MTSMTAIAIQQCSRNSSRWAMKGFFNDESVVKIRHWITATIPPDAKAMKSVTMGCIRCLRTPSTAERPRSLVRDEEQASDQHANKVNRHRLPVKLTTSFGDS